MPISTDPGYIIAGDSEWPHIKTEVDILLELGCRKDAIEYLGDGVYVGTEDWQIWLCCRRDNGFSYIALDNKSIHTLMCYLEKENP